MLRQVVAIWANFQWTKFDSHVDDVGHLFIFIQSHIHSVYSVYVRVAGIFRKTLFLYRNVNAVYVQSFWYNDSQYKFYVLFFPTDIKNRSYEVLTAHLYRHKHYEKVTTRSSTGGAASHAI